MTPEPQDAELLSRIAAGSKEAGERFAARHLDAVWHYARRLGGDASGADDVTQETFVAAFRAAEGFRGTGSARGWLFTIARHEWLHGFRRRSGEPAAFVPLVDEDTLPQLGAAAGWGADPERAAEAAEDGARLDAALLSLPIADREVLLLRDVEGLSTAEAAASLGIAPAAARVRLHRARLRLMAALRTGEHHAD